MKNENKFKSQDPFFDFQQDYMGKFDEYNQSIYNIGKNNASNVMNAPSRGERIRKSSFLLRLPTTLISIPIYTGLSLLKLLHLRKESKKAHVENEVVDLYSKDGDYWGEKSQ